jgi:uncharacterized membrane protein
VSSLPEDGVQAGIPGDQAIPGAGAGAEGTPGAVVLRAPRSGGRIGGDKYSVADKPERGGGTGNSGGCWEKQRSGKSNAGEGVRALQKKVYT